MQRLKVLNISWVLILMAVHGKDFHVFNNVPVPVLYVLLRFGKTYPLPYPFSWFTVYVSIDANIIIVKMDFSHGCHPWISYLTC